MCEIALLVVKVVVKILKVLFNFEECICVKKGGGLRKGKSHYLATLDLINIIPWYPDVLLVFLVYQYSLELDFGLGCTEWTKTWIVLHQEY